MYNWLETYVDLYHTFASAYSFPSRALPTAEMTVFCRGPMTQFAESPSQAASPQGAVRRVEPSQGEPES